MSAIPSALVAQLTYANSSASGTLPTLDFRLRVIDSLQFELSKGTYLLRCGLPPNSGISKSDSFTSKLQASGSSLALLLRGLRDEGFPAVVPVLLAPGSIASPLVGVVVVGDSGAAAGIIAA